MVGNNGGYVVEVVVAVEGAFMCGCYAGELKLEMAAMEARIVTYRTFNPFLYNI